MKTVLLLFFCTYFLTFAIAQTDKMNQFELSGNIIGRDTGMINIASGFISQDYYPQNLFKPFSTNIINGKFYFKGNLSYPVASRLTFRISSYRYFLSGLFFLCSGKEATTIYTDSINITPAILNSKENSEYINSYLPRLKPILKREEQLYHIIDSVNNKYEDQIPNSVESVIYIQKNKIATEKDSLLFTYTKANPNSFVSLWLLTEQFCIDGYKPLYNKTYLLLSKHIKETYTGRMLLKKIEIAKQTSLMHSFPSLVLKDSANKLFVLKQAFGKTYTLIDFWFSHCGPCIQQFDSLKQIYSDYKRMGFQIIGISVDTQSNKDDWKEIIKKYRLLWYQYIDENGKEATKLSINAFPTNFLLDSTGKIVAKNIELNELRTFLQSHQ